MYVCICNAITDRQIRSAAAAGVTDLWHLQKKLGVAAGCGSCKKHAMEVLNESRSVEPRMYRPAVG
jgi:bacterioferritin-associated ferredoxin